jgi:hypothetical protein
LRIWGGGPGEKKGEKGKRKNGEKEKEITKANKVLFAFSPLTLLTLVKISLAYPRKYPG